MTIQSLLDLDLALIPTLRIDGLPKRDRLQQGGLHEESSNGHETSDARPLFFLPTWIWPNPELSFQRTHSLLKSDAFSLLDQSNPVDCLSASN